MGAFSLLGLDGTYSRKQVRQGLGAMVGGKLSTRPLGGQSGLTSPVTLTVTSTVWTVGSFTAVTDLESDATMGTSWCVSDGNQTGAVTAASGSFIRYDLLYLTLDDATSTVPTIEYVAGTSATTLPATPSEAIPFAQITVPRSGTGSPTIALIAPHAAAVGGILQVASSGAYPDQPYIGLAVYDLALDHIVVFTANGWEQFSTAAARRQIGNATTSVASGSVEALVTSYGGVGGFAVGDISYASGIFTVVTPGVYMWAASWTFSPGVSDGVFRLTGYIKHNGTQDGGGQSCQLINTASFSGITVVDAASHIVQCAAGDTIQLAFTKNGSGATLAVTAASFALTRVA